MPASLKIDSSVSAVAYHVIDGPKTFPYAIDAHSAVSRFPGEWSFAPWSADDAAAARESLSERHARETEEAKANGLAPPPPLPEPVQPTPEEQAAIDEHAKAVAEANERLAVFREEQRKRQEIADQIAADEALVASPPPRPDPTARRPLTPAQIRKRSAETDEERIAREQTEAVAAASQPQVAQPAAAKPTNPT